MVMKSDAMRRNLRRSIRKSLGRYLAIVAIIALGASMFVGLLTSKGDMVVTGQKYMDDQNMFDLRLINTYGWAQKQVDAVAALPGVVDAEGVFYIDVIANMDQEESEAVYRVYSLPEKINRVVLRGGRMPETPDECLIDGYHASDRILGSTITVARTNDDNTLDALAYDTYTVVGFVSTPLYMDMNRGTTSVGSGSLKTYLYFPREGFDVDYYTEIHVTIPGDYRIYTDEYNDAMSAAADTLEPLLQPLAEERLNQVRMDAEQAYRDGMAEYDSGLEDYNTGKAEAEQKLLDAYRELMDARQQIADNEDLLTDGERQIADAKQTLKDSEKQMRQSRQALASARASAYAQLADANAQLFRNYKTVNASLQQVTNGLLQLSTGMIELNAGITQLESGLSQLDTGIRQLGLLLDIMDASISTAQTALDYAKQVPEADLETIAQLEEQLAELKTKRDEYAAQKTDLEAQRVQYGAQLDELYAKRTELEAQKSDLEANRTLLQQAMDTISEGFLELSNNQSQMENQFAAAEAQLEAGQLLIDSSQEQIKEKEAELSDGWAALEEAKAELNDGWQEYYDGKAKSESELYRAKWELFDAEKKLSDAREAIDEMTGTSVYVLDRTTNIGYCSLDSTSDIVAGVSRVFPAFFLLIASLVCITTMTRMVDEERTQIGTLKALGYSSGAIISKYLLYAGSASLIGCVIGVIGGSVVFPMILWEAYKIMLYIAPQIILHVNWLLCGTVVTACTAVMLAVTWYCCRRELREVPAELIRPKPPTVGHTTIIERLPFWRRISFLNKVTIRNILRYRQRLAMMLVGIGGCTALLLTGFGLRDTITNICTQQFEEVAHYDMAVYFTDGQSDAEQAAFRRALGEKAENVLFYNQTSAELDFDNQVHEIYLMTSSEEIRQFIDLRNGSRDLEMPGPGEVLLTVGVAEAMNIRCGDQVVLRNADMQELSLTVSGIYDNYVYNYAIVTPESVEAQWGKQPEKQMALLRTVPGVDVHAVSAQTMGLSDVMNITVSEDLAAMVSSMMDALDMIVVVVVFCAALLAITVLYNLTNINIGERIREIATIKVLGFDAAETAAYVFKENLSLTVVGAVVGLPFGYGLLAFVMSQIKINIVWFQPNAAWLSYVLAIALTLLSAVAVDFIFYFKLDRINMAEALKSVE